MKRKKIVCLLVISMLCIGGCGDKIEKEEKRRSRGSETDSDYLGGFPGISSVVNLQPEMLLS